jgi:hypothetical protein
MEHEESNNDGGHFVCKNEIEDEKLRSAIPEGARINVVKGSDFDFASIKIDEDIPQTRAFRVYKYKNPRTQRNVTILKCDCFKEDQSPCDMHFRKWHNFFDHLRTHTKERPFKCNEHGCNQSFTQKANLNKHLAVHLRRKRQKCPMCSKVFMSTQILKVSAPFVLP